MCYLVIMHNACTSVLCCTGWTTLASDWLCCALIVLIVVFISIQSSLALWVHFNIVSCFCCTFFRVSLWCSGNPQLGDSKAASIKGHLHARLDPNTGEDWSYSDRWADTSVQYGIVQSIYHWTHYRVHYCNVHFSCHRTHSSGHHCSVQSIYHWLNVQSIRWFPAVCQDAGKTVTIWKVSGTQDTGKVGWVWNSPFYDYVPDLNSWMSFCQKIGIQCRAVNHEPFTSVQSWATMLEICGTSLQC